MSKTINIRIRKDFVEKAEERAKEYRQETGENITRADVINAILMESKKEIENTKIEEYINNVK